MNDICRITREFISENFLYMRPNAKLADEDRLLETGIIDSMGVVELVEFLEQEFSFEVGGEEITEENLGSISAIERYVVSKQ